VDVVEEHGEGEYKDVDGEHGEGEIVESMPIMH
jgi:hypothetical protein